MTPQPPDDLNALLAPLQARAIDATTVARQRAAFLRKARPSSPWRARGWATALALLPLGAACVWLLTHRQPQTLTATVDLHAVRVGAWISAPENQSLPVRFSDGSALRLHPGARVRLASLTPRGAAVVIEDGAVDVRVRHRVDTSWRLTAGPYAVDVTGTAFSVAWRSREGAIDLAMREGAVILRGPRMGDGVAVRGHEEAHARVEALASNAPVDAETPDDEGTDSADAGRLEVVARAPRAHRPRPASTGLGSRDAAVALTSGGEDHAVEVTVNEETDDSTGVARLMELADRRRLDGEIEHSRRLMVRVRQRFAGSEQAHRAAFLLGIIALNESRTPSVAARWFELYLRESPSGPLANEARGRLMQAREQAGDREGARSAAAEYLVRDPEGMFAPVARSLVE